MINNYFRIVLCSVALVGFSFSIHAQSKCGPAVNALMRGMIAGYYGYSQPKPTPASDKATIILKMNSAGKENKDFELCHEEDTIIEAVIKGTLSSVEEEAQKIDYRITNDRITAGNIAATIKEEAASLIHPSGVARFGCLAEFTGNNLEKKVRNYYGNSEQVIKEKALDYLSLYASPFSIHTVDLRNMSALYHRIEKQDSMTSGNITAIANTVAQKLRGTNPTADIIKNEVIDATRNHIIRNVKNKATSLYHNSYKTNQIVDIITQEFNEIISQYIRDYGISSDALGKLNKFFGESLDNKIQQHYDRLSK